MVLAIPEPNINVNNNHYHLNKILPYQPLAHSLPDIPATGMPVSCHTPSIQL
jgi:hypothetical protein